MAEIIVRPIAFVRNSRPAIEDDDWGDVLSEIALTDAIDDAALVGIEEFSHVEIIFHFHLVEAANVESGARRPRNNPDWPEVGILAQRGKNRPNRLGLTTAKVIERRDRVLVVAGLDAIDGTPVLDIKPVMREFLPREDVRQPAWSTDLMRKYWKAD